MTDANLPEKSDHASPLLLPSGRTIRVSATERTEQLEILSPDGSLELRIAMTPQGPVLSLSGVRLELNTTESIALHCGELAINSTRGISMNSDAGIQIQAGGDLRAKAMGNADLDAQVINLNCGDRSQYNDASHPTIELPQPTSINPPDGHNCDCRH